MNKIKLKDYKTIKKRKEFLEKNLGFTLNNIGKYIIDEKIASGKNCENMIGATQIPLGIAGPLVTKSPSQKANRPREIYVPLATTEGALVASANRGCKVIRKSGGAVVHADKVGATRGPVFYIESIRKRIEVSGWIIRNKDKIAGAAGSTSKHLKLRNITSKGAGNYYFIRFSFDTGEAMGMNMVTIATQKIVELLEKELEIKCLSVAGNFDIDKKPAWLNFINNRGTKTWAEVVIPNKYIRIILKTTPENIFETWLAKCMVGSAMSGSLGFNAQFANIIAAIFIATGQDPAHVIEGSMGITTTKILKNGDLYFSVYLPALMVGTIGGGTELETQKEALSILGIKNGDSSVKLAEIIAGTVLAGEISLLASQAEGSLASTHQRLGR